MEPIILFVYGAMRGNLNGRPGGSHYLLRECEFMGRAETKKPMGLYAGVIPFVDPNKSISPVQGELYRIMEPRIFATIDDMQGEFKKVHADVVDEMGNEVRALMYVFENPPGQVIPNGDYADFIAKKR